MSFDARRLLAQRAVRMVASASSRDADSTGLIRANFRDADYRLRAE